MVLVMHQRSKTLKQHRRREERRWGKTRLTIHRHIFMTHRHKSNVSATIGSETTEFKEEGREMCAYMCLRNIKNYGAARKIGKDVWPSRLWPPAVSLFGMF
ncbi:hypothetical protein ElyMa_006504300 [Elysia marginata]|uniref:Uncharacterized protein n=1 Tax=Elysia marginata TaxID=1093978 RepID=A0AAV4I5L9_9GAST|nr:hypothetical protein ElyMa_006504300 [Elysia marginata]